MTHASLLPGPDLLDDPGAAMTERIAWRVVLEAVESADTDAELAAAVRRAARVWWHIRELPETAPGEPIILVTGTARGADFMSVLRDLERRRERLPKPKRA